MSSIANDEGVWSKITWKGTEAKDSFQTRYAVIMNIMRNICTETFPENNNAFFESKIKSFLRHAPERLKRKQSNYDESVQ